MNLAQALRLQPSLQNSASHLSDEICRRLVIAFVGAGGKSTAMFQLARQLPPPVVVTATTHLGAWQTSLADEHIIANSAADLENFTPCGVTLVTGPLDGDRTRGLGHDAKSWLHANCRSNRIPLLIEADGSHQLPLKAPAPHEPAIPVFVEQVIQVAGLTGLGKSLDEKNVHRPDIFASLSGLRQGETITPEALARVLTHPDGGLKNIPPGAHHVALLNQADTPELQAVAQEISQKLLPNYGTVITANLNRGIIYAVREPIAGIILAAGEATRLGKPKQLLDWRGQPFVRAVASTALQAGLWPVVVVTGAYAADVESALGELDVRIVHNKDWMNGQASSIKAGVSTLTGPHLHFATPPPFSDSQWGRPGGCIFLLADQPQVTPPILRALMDEHARTLAPVIAPMVLDRRANPVLFDQVAFPDLLQLQGDVGGRGAFSKHRVHYLPWQDESLLMDVDTLEDYRRLKETLE